MKPQPHDFCSVCRYWQDRLKEPRDSHDKQAVRQQLAEHLERTHPNPSTGGRKR